MSKQSKFFESLTCLWAIKSTLILLLTPVCLLPLAIMHDSKEARCAYGLGVMATYWVTEVLPLAATALLPVVLFPVLGVLPVAEVCRSYIKDTSMFGIGCLTFAIAVETSNLHKRLAILTLLRMGSNPAWLMLGFMLPTWFVSLWVNNTSATAMMIPIVAAILSKLENTENSSPPCDTGSLSHNAAKPREVSVEAGAAILSKLDNTENSSPPCDTGSLSHNAAKPSEVSVEAGAAILSKLDNTENSSPPCDTGSLSHTAAKPSEVSVRAGVDTVRKEGDMNVQTPLQDASAAYCRICKGMSLCVAFAANIGGTGALSGTSTNLVMLGHVERLYEEYGLESGVTFTSWMVFALPGAFLSLLLAWLWLALLYCGPRTFLMRERGSKEKDLQVRKTLLCHYQELGPVTFEEKVVIGHFLVLICLWLSRNPPLLPGWNSLFPPKYVGESAAAILVALSLFVFPAQRPTFFCNKISPGEQPRASRTVLDWKTVQAKYPWGILLLLGGGFALADACEASGLSRWIGGELKGLGEMPPSQLLFVLTIIVAMATEVTSNAATASVLLPVLGQLVRDYGWPSVLKSTRYISSSLPP